MHSFEDLVANYANAIATGASTEESLAHLQALLDWYEQVVKLATFANDSGYEFKAYGFDVTCRGCNGTRDNYGIIQHELDCPILFASDLVYEDEHKS